MLRREFLGNGLLLGVVGLWSGMGFSLPIRETALSENVDMETSKQFFLAIIEEQVEVVEALIRNGIDVNVKGEEGWTALHCAIALGNSNITVLKLLVANGAEVNAKANDGSTPLHEATAWGNVESVRFLVANGADVNARNDYGVAPLDFATVRFEEASTTDTAAIFEYLSSIVNGHA